jgi:hypothetical protein
MQILRLAQHDLYFTADQVARILMQFAESSYRVQVVAALMHRVVDQVNVPFELLDLLDSAELLQLQTKLGPMFDFGQMNPTGHYRLSLGSEVDRFLARQLIQVAREENAQLQAADATLDSSPQEGGSVHRSCSSYRNVVYDAHDGQGPQPWALQLHCPALPQGGMLELDYVRHHAMHCR